MAGRLSVNLKPGGEKALKLNPTGAYDKVPADLAKDEEGANLPLVACPNCGRKFREDRIDKHQTACSKISDGSSRRGVFSVSQTEHR